MPERKLRLRATLAELHEQLEGTEPVEAGLRDELRTAMHEIEAVLEAGGEPAEREGVSFSERLSGLALRFEGSHPRLAEAVGRLIHGVAELGI